MNTGKKNKIAVIGLDCKFPAKSNGPDKFWEALLHKKNGIVPVPNDRWNHSYYYDPQGGKGKTYVDSAGFIDDVFNFCPSNFGMSEKEVADIDPQHRLLIQTSWNSIQNAGYKIDTIKENTGAFFGISYKDYHDFDIAPNGANSFTPSNPLGNANAIAAGRVSYLLGLKGPTLQIDTICSSSLMTLHLASQSLLNGECDYALSGGVNCVLSPHALVALSQMGALSKSAKCQAFSKHADGYIRGEGVGVLLLKRLEDAERDGDYIYGVVEATATNHDGRSNGLTAPNGKAQEKLIVSCIKKAGLSPADIGYVEAHGTGTYLGDPVELEALYKVFGDSVSKDMPLLTGSVKSNIGHLEPAAGVASLIKSLLILKNNVIPAGLHLEELNPAFKWNDKHILPVNHNTTWNDEDKCIGISAFSMTGANVHAILGSAPKPKKVNQNALVINKWPIILSAQNKEKLTEYITSLLNTIDSKTPISALSNTLINGRELFQDSIYEYFNSTQDVIEALEHYQNDNETYSFKSVSLSKKRKNQNLELYIDNFPKLNSEYLKHWQNEDLFKLAFSKINLILNKLLGKNLEAILSNEKTNELEQNILRFTQAFIWIDAIVSISNTNTSFKTSGEGDYLGAIFSELLTLEEALMLFILNDDKRTKLLERLNFGESNTNWKKSEEANNKEFWIGKQNASSTENISVNIKNDTVNISIVQNKTLDKLTDFLLYAHAKGVDINWTIYTGNSLLNKLPLPPPPLATKTYVSQSYTINSQKNPSVSSDAEFANRIASILHKQIDTKNDNLKQFMSSFSPETDDCIKDHIVNGVYILPGTGYISMAYEALFYLHKSRPVTLKNVQIFQPMRFDSLYHRRDIKLELTYNAQKSLTGSWEITSKTKNEDWVTHIKGGFEVLKNNTVNTTTANFKQDDLNLLDVNAFYSHLENWGLQYGPKFRLIQALESNEFTMRAVVEQQDSMKDLQASPELLDSCMHALFSAKVFEGVLEPFVPSRYDEITLYKPLHGPIHASGTLLDTNSNAMTGQFSFCDANGHTIMEVKSMEVRKILNQFLDSKDDSAPVYEENWTVINTLNDIIESKNSMNQYKSNTKWVLLDNEHANQVNKETKNLSNRPDILCIDKQNKQNNTDFEVFETPTSFVKSLQSFNGKLVFFAPTIQDISKLSSVFNTFKHILLEIPNHLSFRLCTTNGVSVKNINSVNPFHTALWGMARTMPIEAKQLWKGVIDIQSTTDVSNFLNPILQDCFTKYDQLVLRDTNIYTPILNKTTKQDLNQQNTNLSWTNPVLITGGLGQMGRLFTEQLVKQGCKQIYLMSRNTSWLETEDATNLNISKGKADFRTYLKACKVKGISIIPVKGDVSSNNDMAVIAKQLNTQNISNINIIHAAGSISRKKLIELDIKELEQEWTTKYIGAVLLDTHFKSFNVGFTLYTSSIASLWSGEGVAGYSSSNLLLDGLAVNKNLKGERTCSVRFGRFKEKGLMKDSEAKELESSGVLDLPMHEAINKALYMVSKSNDTTPSIMNIDWKRFKPLYELLNHNKFLSALLQIDDNSNTSIKQNLKNNLDKPLRDILRNMVAQELEIEVSDVDPSIPLFELGLDSLHSLGIRTDLEQMLGIELSVSLIYDFNTVDLLSQHLESLIQTEVDLSNQENQENEESEDELLELLNAELL